MKKISRKRIWIVGVLALVVAATFFGLNQLQNGSSALAETDGTGEIVSAFIGDLSASATASG
ncbi:MAG: hypothetical protein GQ526_12370, partial [Ardenticatenales bacterium]|nr:hypothetical protein [Ardenticatenales bacterium]